MLRKLTIVSVLAAFIGALTLSTAADARGYGRGGYGRGGYRGGYGFRGGYRGGYYGGGWGWGYPYYGYGGCWRWWYGRRVWVC